jgi:formate dehydrogenase iron-sulfur subunit
MVASPKNFPLLAELLAEQQRLDTPVARFSAAHDQLAPGVGALAPQLIPLSRPAPGEQYAFEVDLDSCTGCKSCVAACHALNGLDDTETWRDVGVIVSPSRAHPFTQTVTTACHHCADPACLNGCPVLAYEKDLVTGIVRHLDDQCIGCSYCILKCPYDVPKFSTRLGIVRKCDMCHSRLAEGEAPACAQACPTHAIRIVTVKMTATTPAPVMLPATADAGYTRPTTQYRSKRPLPERLVAGDAAALRVQPAHWPLVIMLTLLPVAVGTAWAALVLRRSGGPPAGFALLPAVSWGCGLAGLGASVFHLGQPLRAWRIFLGWRKSWLSREAMVFGVWMGVATAALVLPAALWASAIVGTLGLGCSALIYADTRREFWRPSQSFGRFLGTALLVSLALVQPKAAAIVLLVKLALEARTFYDGSVSARLQRGPLRQVGRTRDALGIGAAVLLILGPAALALLPLLAGEFLERSLFFRAVDAPKMPGMAA